MPFPGTNHNIHIHDIASLQLEMGSITTLGPHKPDISDRTCTGPKLPDKLPYEAETHSVRATQ